MSVPVTGCGVVGVNVRFAAHVLPAGIAVQLWVTAKAVDAAIDETVTKFEPELVNTTTFVGEVVWTDWPAKSTEAGFGTKAPEAPNVAVTLAAALIKTVQLALPLHAPDQFKKTWPTPALAVSVTLVPETKVAAHVVGQLTPTGDEVTVPEPPIAMESAYDGFESV